MGGTLPPLAPVVSVHPKGSYAISDSYLGPDQSFMTAAEQTAHVHESELELYLKDELSRESLAAIDTHLRSCQACSGKLAEQDKCLWYLAELSSNEDSGRERRRHPRLATDDPASLQVLNPFSDDVWEVRIVDVSISGVRTFTPKGLLPGSLIKVKMQYSVACGDVRYCIPADNGFFAGIRLHDYFVPKA